MHKKPASKGAGFFHEKGKPFDKLRAGGEGEKRGKD
jgi:hypothetical protein